MRSAVSTPADSWIEKHHFLLRRLHSLSGVFPIGVFLINHLLTNSLTTDPLAFNEEVHWIHSLPYLIFIEFGMIFLPLAFHAGYGIVIARQGRANVIQYGWLDNWRYTLQRTSGWIAAAFIVIHLAHFRFAHWFGGPTYVGTPDPYGMTQEGFYQVLPSVAWYTIYTIGLIASVYHFANGLCTFCITWGITVGDQSRRRVSVVAALIGLLLLGWGFKSLYGIGTGGPPDRLENVAQATQSPEAPGG